MELLINCKGEVRCLYGEAIDLRALGVLSIQRASHVEPDSNGQWWADLATSGGILETKKIGDAIQEFGVPMAMHFAGTPVSCMANVHCAAATESFLVLENHSVDVPWWSDLVNGVEKPIVNKGFITVPEKPGLGITLNDAVVKQHLLEPGYFEPTPEWNKERSHDRLWS